ncbi:hypothetical protein ACM61V_21045 [Sphingomonas sp. TX0543]|jgi:hypothetical protein|uniref:hypothetical protein n=1 Tax=Bacteria TaxID=2 RepID=UPI001396B917|nr:MULTISPECIES: hypothetical protein [Bacteria]MCP8892439.1 hypothetical protein [Sphingomonas faeni]
MKRHRRVPRDGFDRVDRVLKPGGGKGASCPIEQRHGHAHQGQSRPGIPVLDFAHRVA